MRHLLLNWLSRYSLVLDLIRGRLGRKSSILEVGSGPSGLAGFLNRDVVGLDVSFVERPGPSLTPIRGQAVQMPFRDAAFDLVISLDMLEHLEPADRPAAIAEMYRVSRSCLIISCPVGDTARKCDEDFAAWMRRGRREFPDWLFEHLRIPSPEDTEVYSLVAQLPGSSVEVIPNENAAFHRLAMIADHSEEVLKELVPSLNADMGSWRAICKGINFGECYRLFFLVTRDDQRLRAVARGGTTGVRKQKQLLAALEFKMGLQEAFRGDFEKAAAHFEAVIDKGEPPELAIAASAFVDEIAAGCATLGTALEELGDLPCVSGLGSDAWKRFYLRLAMSLSALGKNHQAAKIITRFGRSRLSSEGSAVELALEEGRTLQRLGRLQSAAKRFREIIDAREKDDPTAGMATYLLSDTWLAQGKIQPAMNLLRGLVSTFEKGDLVFSARLKMGAILQEGGDHSSALREFELARAALSAEKRLNAAHDRWNALSTAKCLAALGRLDEAAATLERLERSSKKGDKLARDIAFEGGLIYQRQGRLRAAANRFRDAMNLSSDALEAGWARYSLADTLAALNRADEALSHLREVASASTSGDHLLCSARAQIGSILMGRQDFEGALDQFKLAAKTKATDRRFRGWVFFSMAQCFKQLGAIKEARRYFAKLAPKEGAQPLLSDPEMLVSSFWEHAHLAYSGKRPGRAISDFVRCIESVVKEKRDAQEIAFRSVMVLHEAGAFDAASRLLKSLSKVIDLEGRFWRLALAYKRRGILTSAEDMMSSLEFLPPSEQAEWHLSAASLLLEMGYDQDAEDEVRSALQLRSDWPQANYVLGSILEKRRNFDEASARFEAVLEREDNVGKELWSRIIGGAHYHLACILERRGEKERALAHLESCLKIMPRHRKAAELRHSLLSVVASVTG